MQIGLLLSPNSQVPRPLCLVLGPPPAAGLVHRMRSSLLYLPRRGHNSRCGTSAAIAPRQPLGPGPPAVFRGMRVHPRATVAAVTQSGRAGRTQRTPQRAPQGTSCTPDPSTRAAPGAWPPGNSSPLRPRPPAAAELLQGSELYWPLSTRQIRGRRG